MKTMFIALMVTFGAVAAQAHGHDHGPRPVPQEGLCATAYASADYSRPRLQIYDGTRISDLTTVRMHHTGSSWDNQISSIRVEPGCKFVGYQYLNYNTNLYTGEEMYGFRMSLDNRDGAGVYVKYMNEYKNDRISSLKCRCE
jgi:hypothetical protein